MTGSKAHSKGTNLIDMVKFLRSRRERALELLPSHLHPYLEKRIDVSAWYPEEDVHELTRALAVLLPDRGESIYRTLGELNARNHTEGRYGHLLGEVKLETLAIRVRALWKTLHDTGELEFEADPERGGRARLRGYANPGPEMCQMIGTYLADLVARTGFEGVVPRHERCVHDGDAECAWSLEGTPRR